MNDNPLIREHVSQALARDGLAEAEQATGRSYKDDEFTKMLGLMNHFDAARDRETLMRMTDDTDFACELPRYLRIAGELGFRVVLKDDFRDETRDADDSLYVLWRDDGVLLSFDTYYGSKKLNGGKFYYNWKPNDAGHDSHFQLTSSGQFWMPESLSEPTWEQQYHYVDGRIEKRTDPEAVAVREEWERTFRQRAVWIGDHDCREALRHHVGQLLRHGAFVVPWVKAPHLWLTHYYEMEPFQSRACGDFKAYGRAADEKTAERISRMPRDVQEAIAAWKPRVRERAESAT